MPHTDIERLIRPHLLGLQTYDPVEPSEALAQRAGVPADRVIRLNGNENPYGGSPRAAEAVARVPLHIYPDPLQRRVRGALARYAGVDPASVVVGAGSDEIIDLLFRLFVSPGDKVLDCAPTFGMYGFFARVTGAEVTTVSRDAAFELDVDAIRRATDSRTKVLFIASPNNPTGNVASEEQVRALLDMGLALVVDEAYHEFCGQTVAPLLREYENLVVLRTMSKWAGLAGLRVGYGIMAPKVARYLIDIKSPYNVSVTAEAAAIASVEDAPALLGNVRKIVDERDRMFSLLAEKPGVSPWPSGGNFLLCQFPPGVAGKVFDGLARRGIFVRTFGSERLRDFLRVGVGTPAQTDAVVDAIGELAEAN